MIFVTNLKKILPEIDKIGDISKFEILNPKIQNLRSLTLKSKIFDFDKISKIWPKIKIPPRWFIITLRFHQNSKVKILKHLSQYRATRVTRFFQNFEVDIKITKSPNWLSSPKFWRKFLKPGPGGRSAASWRLNSGPSRWCSGPAAAGPGGGGGGGALGCTKCSGGCPPDFDGSFSLVFCCESSVFCFSGFEGGDSGLGSSGGCWALSDWRRSWMQGWGVDSDDGSSLLGFFKTETTKNEHVKTWRKNEKNNGIAHEFWN